MLPSQLEVELREFIRRLRIFEDEARLAARDVAALYSDLPTTRVRVPLPPTTTIVTISGLVRYDCGAGYAIPGLAVTITGTGVTTATGTTDGSGAYSVAVTLAPGTTGATVSVGGTGTRFAPGTQAVSWSSGATTATATTLHLLAGTGHVCFLSCSTPVPTTLNGSDQYGSFTLTWGGTNWSVTRVVVNDFTCPSAGAANVTLTYTLGVTAGLSASFHGCSVGTGDTFAAADPSSAPIHTCAIGAASQSCGPLALTFTAECGAFGFGSFDTTTNSWRAATGTVTITE